MKIHILFNKKFSWNKTYSMNYRNYPGDGKYHNYKKMTILPIPTFLFVITAYYIDYFVWKCSFSLHVCVCVRCLLCYVLLFSFHLIRFFSAAFSLYWSNKKRNKKLYTTQYNNGVGVYLFLTLFLFVINKSKGFTSTCFVTLYVYWAICCCRWICHFQVASIRMACVFAKQP